MFPSFEWLFFFSSLPHLKVHSRVSSLFQCFALILIEALFYNITDEYGNLVRYEGRNDQLNVYQRPNQQPLDTYYRQNRAPSFNDYYRRKQLDAYFQQLERNADNRLPRRQESQGYGDVRKNQQETVELGTPLTNKDASKKSKGTYY